jgi:hypothetical protein
MIYLPGFVEIYHLSSQETDSHYTIDIDMTLIDIGGLYRCIGYMQNNSEDKSY